MSKVSLNPSLTEKLINKTFQIRRRIDEKIAEAVTQGQTDEATINELRLQGCKANTFASILLNFQEYQRDCEQFGLVLKNKHNNVAVKRYFFYALDQDPTSIHDLPLTRGDIEYAEDPKNQNDPFAKALREHPDYIRFKTEILKVNLEVAKETE